MAILSVQLGTTSTSFLMYKSANDYSYYYYPYSYSPVFVNTDKKEFYIEVFDVISGQMGMNHTECELILTNVFDYSLGDYPVKSAHHVTKVLSNIKNYDYFYVDPYTLIQGDQFLSAYPYNPASNIFRLNEMEKFNYLANSALYINSVPDKDFDIFDRDDITRFLSEQLPTPPRRNNKVIFTGDRFATLHSSKSLSYLLAIDLIKQPGIYEIYVDCCNSLVCASHLEMYSKSAEHLVDNLNLLFVGNLINAPGGVECLIRTSVGTSQMLQFHTEGLQILPLEKDNATNLVVKHQSISSVDKSVKGGELGLIVDTRQKASTLATTDAETRHKKYRDWQHTIQETLTEL